MDFELKRAASEDGSVKRDAGALLPHSEFVLVCFASDHSACIEKILYDCSCVWRPEACVRKISDSMTEEQCVEWLTFQNLRTSFCGYIFHTKCVFHRYRDVQKRQRTRGRDGLAVDGRICCRLLGLEFDHNTTQLKLTIVRPYVRIEMPRSFKVGTRLAQ